MNGLPNWVWDLIADLVDEEDMHPKLYADMYNMAAGKHQMTRYPWCPAHALQRVPPDVLDHARVIASYRQAVTAETPANREEVSPDTGPEAEPAGNKSTDSSGSAERTTP